MRIYLIILLLLKATSVSAIPVSAMADPAHTVSGKIATSPYTVVKTSTDELLLQLKSIEDLYQSNPEDFYFKVDSALAPYIDFDGFARSVMAKYYRRASDAQKQAFIKVFRQGLIETYAKALLGFDNQRITVLKPGGPQKFPDRASISLEIQGKNATIYKVVYSLRLIDDEWRLRNLVINGINIGFQFRSQFRAAMQKHQNNMDEVIKNWSLGGASDA